MTDFVKARRYMVDCQVRPADVTDHALLAALDSVARETFLPEALRPIAYLDRQLDVGGRVLLTPMVFARLVQALALTRQDRVLDVGCGLGYSSAVLSAMAASVTGLESDAGLASEAGARIAAAGLTNVTIASGALDAVPAGASFDAILVNGAVESIPAAWVNALADRGRIAVVVGSGRSARAILMTKSGGTTGERVLFDASAPFLGELAKKPEFAF